jgi:hypothetical protein
VRIVGAEGEHQHLEIAMNFARRQHAGRLARGRIDNREIAGRQRWIRRHHGPLVPASAARGANGDQRGDPSHRDPP